MAYHSESCCKSVIIMMSWLFCKIEKKKKSLHHIAGVLWSKCVKIHQYHKEWQDLQLWTNKHNNSDISKSGNFWDKVWQTNFRFGFSSCQNMSKNTPLKSFPWHFRVAKNFGLFNKIFYTLLMFLAGKFNKMIKYL